MMRKKAKHNSIAIELASGKYTKRVVANKKKFNKKKQRQASKKINMGL